MKINQLLLELSSYEAAEVTVDNIILANKSKLTVPKTVLNDWKSGVYDEDPNILKEELMSLLTQAIKPKIYTVPCYKVKHNTK